MPSIYYFFYKYSLTRMFYINEGNISKIFKIAFSKVILNGFSDGTRNLDEIYMRELCNVITCFFPD